MLIEQVEADARTQWTVQAVFAAAGARGVEQKTPDDLRDRLELWLDGDLTARPEGVDEEQWALRLELGVA